MKYQRPPRPDPFEVMIHARRRVFIQANGDEYIVIVALKFCIDVQRWQGTELCEVVTVWRTPEDLGLFDGQAWNIPALAKWIEQHCVVCWQPLVGKQRMYDSNRCKQKAYRSRK